jgi:AcrR family transcriptional regulator
MSAIEEHGSVTDRILEAADDCFTTYGISKTTMDDVARRAQVSRATVYRYFSDRESLMLESIRRRSRRTMAPARARLMRWGTFAERLEEGICIDVRRGRADPVIQLLSADQRLATKILGDTGVAVELTHELWEPILLEAREKGELRGDIDLRELSSWISHLETMFVTQFSDEPATQERVRSMLRQFVLPALVARGRESL